MKKVTAIVTAFAILASNAGYAQSMNRDNRDKDNCHKECRTYDRKPLNERDREKNMAGTECCADLQWGIGLVGLAVLGVVVGLTASAATSNGSTYAQ